jgi:hypothetical protein
MASERRRYRKLLVNRPWQTPLLLFAVLRQFSLKAGLDKARPIPSKTDNIHRGHATMGVSRDVMGRADYQGVCDGIERMRGATCVRIPIDFLDDSKMPVQ